MCQNCVQSSSICYQFMSSIVMRFLIDLRMIWHMTERYDRDECGAIYHCNTCGYRSIHVKSPLLIWNVSITVLWTIILKLYTLKISLNKKFHIRKEILFAISLEATFRLCRWHLEHLSKSVNFLLQIETVSCVWKNSLCNVMTEASAADSGV